MAMPHKEASKTHDESVNDLVRARLDAGQPLWLTIATGSMWPALRPGDRVLMRAARVEALRRGDIVVLRSSGTRLIHRLIGRISQNEQLLLVTKGDNCAEGDKPWPATQLLGVVVAVERQGRKLDLRSARARSVGAFAAMLSRGQRLAHRKLGGLPRRALCRFLGLALRGVVSLG